MMFVFIPGIGTVCAYLLGMGMTSKYSMAPLIIPGRIVLSLGD